MRIHHLLLAGIALVVACLTALYLAGILIGEHYEIKIVEKHTPVVLVQSSQVVTYHTSETEVVTKLKPYDVEQTLERANLLREGR